MKYEDRKWSLNKLYPDLRGLLLHGVAFIEEIHGAICNGVSVLPTKRIGAMPEMVSSSALNNLFSERNALIDDINKQVEALKASYDIEASRKELLHKQAEYLAHEVIRAHKNIAAGLGPIMNGEVTCGCTACKIAKEVLGE